MCRANILVNYVLTGIALPLALLTLLSLFLAVAQGQTNFFIPPAYAGTGYPFVALHGGNLESVKL
jgi:hypothetical protein